MLNTCSSKRLLMDTYGKTTFGKTEYKMIGKDIPCKNQLKETGILCQYQTK